MPQHIKLHILFPFQLLIYICLKGRKITTFGKIPEQSQILEGPNDGNHLGNHSVRSRALTFDFAVWRWEFPDFPSVPERRCCVRVRVRAVRERGGVWLEIQAASLS